MNLETLLTIAVAAAIFLALVALRLLLGGLFRLVLKLMGRAPALRTPAAVRRPVARPRSHAMPHRDSLARARVAAQRWGARTLKTIGGGIAAVGLAVARAGCTVAEAGAAYEAKLRARLPDRPAAPPTAPETPSSVPPQHIDLRDEDPLGMEPPRAVRSSR
ncbi:MAG: hypothetical protein M3N53_03795 [Actinomycetota bacterium]|nr:hypothetical protein [Actinomycetota bacterium]